MNPARVLRSNASFPLRVRRLACPFEDSGPRLRRLLKLAGFAAARFPAFLSRRPGGSLSPRFGLVRLRPPSSSRCTGSFCRSVFAVALLARVVPAAFAAQSARSAWRRPACFGGFFRCRARSRRFWALLASAALFRCRARSRRCWGPCLARVPLPLKASLPLLRRLPWRRSSLREGDFSWP